jgi:hypothetical protein
MDPPRGADQSSFARNRVGNLTLVFLVLFFFKMLVGLEGTLEPRKQFKIGSVSAR